MEALRHKYYTYKDYAEWEIDERYELIDGIVYMMSAPSPIHQIIILEMAVQLSAFIEGSPCRVYISPFDVRLNPDSGDDTVVQPDIFIVCDRTKIDAKGCNGAPDMIIEVLSPSSEKMDKDIKLKKYQDAGVCEYWLIEPDGETVLVYNLTQDGSYDSGTTHRDAGVITTRGGCAVDMKRVFDKSRIE